MAEQIRVFELKIDVDAAIKSTSQLKTTTDNLKKTLNEFKQAGDTSSEAYVRTAAAVKNSSKEYNAAQTQIGKLLALQGKEIKTVEQGRNALTILNKEWAKTRSLYGETSKASLKLADQHKMLKDRVNELQKGVGDTSANIGNYSEGFKEAAAQSTIFGRAQRAVNTIMLVAAPVIDLVRKQLQGIKANYIAATAGTKGYTAAQKASAIGTNLVSAALKLFRIALISTGLGAIVVLLGSLVAWLTKTQAGLDFVTKAMAVIGTVVDVFTDRLSALFSAFTKLFSGDFAGGFEDIGKAVSGVGDELSREIKLVIELENELRKLERQQIAISVARSQVNKQVKEQNKIAEDTSKSIAVRQEAIEKAIQLEKDQIKIENENANNRLKNALQLGGTYESNIEGINKIKQAFIDSQGDTEKFENTLRNIGISETTDEDIQKIADAIISNNAQIEASEEKLTTLGNKKNIINNEIENKRKAAVSKQLEDAKKVTDAAIKESQIKLKLFIEQNKGEAESLKEGLKLQEDIRDKKLAIIKQEVIAGNKTKLEGELESLKIKNDFLEQQADLTVDFADKELEAFRFVNQTKIDEGQLLTDELVAQEKSRLEAVAEAERQALKTRLKNGVISQQEYNEAIAEVDAEAKESKDEIELEQKEQKEAADVIDLENKRALSEGNFLEGKEIELNNLKLKHVEELAVAKKAGADVTLVEDRQAEEIKKITTSVGDFKTKQAQKTLGGISEILGKESKAGRAAGIAAATINTYQGVTEVFRAKSVLPEPFGTIQKVVSAGVILKSGLDTVNKIRSTPKAAKGMTLQGNRHAAGGIDLFDGSGSPVVNAEDGENIYVINRNASALINGLSNVNQLTGGVPLSTPVNFAADGGLVQRSIQAGQSGSQVIYKSESINYDLMAEKIGQANLLLPPPVTDVKDIIGQVGSFNDVVDGANL